jgi:serine/threonine protein kinase
MSNRYLAPEYAQYGMVSVRTDVYAFGIVLFQLISGRKVLDDHGGQCTHILQWVLFIVNSAYTSVYILTSYNTSARSNFNFQYVNKNFRQSHWSKALHFTN